ncbi:hypothetical protein [Paenibacillus sp. SYP-B4298]|uniref:hypothetical protein n=1 Tax=Paenibacillus sp. SYP-B4298 TaxID=2996034 RepID=UPI0022DE1D9D|nr:hypothetical protein [Paenibacillus sp. SYP-B4298]
MNDDLAGSSITVVFQQGSWWLSDPVKDVFLSTGINHVDPYFLLGPYNKERSLRVYGDDLIDENGNVQTRSKAFKQWVQNVQTNMSKWGFNTFGYHTCIPYSAISDSLYFIAQIRVLPEQIDFHNFPDVFSETYARQVRDAVQRVCNANKHRKNLIGYGFMDMPALSLGGSKFPPSADCLHHRSHRLFAHKLSEKNQQLLDDPPIHPCVRRYMSLPSHSQGKQAWVRLLRQRYTSPSSVEGVYDVSCPDWEAISNLTEWPEPLHSDQARQDSYAMLECIYDAYYSLHCREIRQVDPHHLILGDKLNGNLPLSHHIVQIVGKYVDVIFYECFSRFEDQVDDLKLVYQMTGKPVLMGDSSFASLSPNQIFSRGTLLRSQEQVGVAYSEYLRQLFTLPFIIGWANCGYMEGWDGLHSPYDPFCSMQSGLVDPFEQVMPHTVRPIALANAAARNWHYQGGNIH